MQMCIYIYYISLSFWVSSCFNKPILSLICRFQKAFSMCSSAVLLWKMKLRLSQHLSAAVQRLGSWFSFQGLAKRRTRGNSECIPNETDVLKLWTPTANPLFFWCAECVCVPLLLWFIFDHLCLHSFSWMGEMMLLVMVQFSFRSRHLLNLLCQLPMASPSEKQSQSVWSMIWPLVST
jgi:hypothetical protein